MADVTEPAAELGARRARPSWAARVRGAVVAVLALAGAVGLVATLASGPLAGLFRPQGAPPSPVPASPSPSLSPSAIPTPGLARFDPAASDGAVLQLFARVLKQSVDSAGEPDGKALTGALAAAGFDPRAMQRSADRTSVDLPAPSISVSVRVRDTCFVGQFVRAERSVVGEVTAPISTGACLIGQTVPVG
ncbi:hypothetical protein [Sinomonas sp. ASV322]|uniref:DUF6993 domain-containing protein n=1 Tax=Sinomonas sp. ASV322 TaxID=3041920 RepID=UPI0027DDA031|nr:hypothetical protein [Sinomonas sp. ASV322]MDQ4502972.1 hypothetical protein [Sinomonas sp. ASV322]